MANQLSQSVLKALRDYIDKKECGLKLKAQYFDGMIMPPSEAQKLGQWFEYKATGGLPPYGGGVPQEKTLKSGKLATSYARMEEQVKNFHTLCKKYNVKILSIGDEKFNYGQAKGTPDIVAEIDGELSIIDLKASGLIRDKWSDFGWEDIANPYKPKVKILTQAMHYKYIAQNLYGKEDVPFYFWVFSTTNPSDHRIIRVEIDEDDYALHERELSDAITFLEKEQKRGFKAHPSLQRCSGCPLAAKCPHAAPVAEVEVVYYSSQITT